MGDYENKRIGIGLSVFVISLFLLFLYLFFSSNEYIKDSQEILYLTASVILIAFTVYVLLTGEFSILGLIFGVLKEKIKHPN